VQSERFILAIVYSLSFLFSGVVYLWSG